MAPLTQHPQLAWWRTVLLRLPSLTWLFSLLLFPASSFLLPLHFQHTETRVVSSIYGKYRTRVKHTWTKSSFVQGLISRCVMRLFKSHLDARHVLCMSVHCVILRGALIHAAVHLHWLDWAENCYCHSGRCNFESGFGGLFCPVETSVAEAIHNPYTVGCMYAWLFAYDILSVSAGVYRVINHPPIQHFADDLIGNDIVTFQKWY